MNLSSSQWECITTDFRIVLRTNEFISRVRFRQKLDFWKKKVAIANSWDEKSKYHWNSFVFFTRLRTFTIHDMYIYIYIFICRSWITESRNDEDISCSKNDLSVSSVRLLIDGRRRFFRSFIRKYKLPYVSSIILRMSLKKKRSDFDEI